MATGPGWTRSNHAPDVTPLAIAPHTPAPSVAAVLGRRNLEADRPMRRRLGDVWLVWGLGSETSPNAAQERFPWH